MSTEYIFKSGRTVERMKSSRNGNPRFRVTFADGTSYPTAPDASCAYGIENRELDGDVQIMINGRGNIVDIRPATPDSVYHRIIDVYRAGLITADEMHHEIFRASALHVSPRVTR